MEDLGAKFFEDKTFAFDYLEINEILFDDSPDVTLICTVPYFNHYYTATFGLSYAQLNSILRSVHKTDSAAIVVAMAEKLNHDIELPSVVDLLEQFGFPLVMDNCILYTTLVELNDDEEDGEGKEDDEEDMGRTYSYDGYYAFLVDEVALKGFSSSRPNTN